MTEHLTEVIPAADRKKFTRVKRDNAPVPPQQGGPAPTSKPRRRRPRRWVVLIVLLALLSAAAGVGGWWFGSGRYVSVPKVVGLTQSAAVAALRSHDLTAVTGSSEYSDTVTSGLVATTTPASGKRLVHGDKVTLHLSLGIKMVTVPTVDGISLESAENALVAAGLAVGDTVEQNSDSVAAGFVITSDPGQQTQVAHTTKVKITVSSGPAQVTLPDLQSDTQQQATDTLTGLGLKYTITQDFSDSVESGSVIRQTPAAGPAHRGDTIALVVSKGPQFVAVPNLDQLSGSAAKALLKQYGLKSDETDFAGRGGVVVYQNPAKGTMVRPGSTVVFATG